MYQRRPPWLTVDALNAPNIMCCVNVGSRVRSKGGRERERVREEDDKCEMPAWAFAGCPVPRSVYN